MNGNDGKNILALDLASRCGFAALKGGQLYQGSWGNPHRYADSPGAFFAAFRDWLAESRRWYEPQLVAWEMTHPHSGAAAMVGYGLITRVQEWSFRHGMIQTYVYPNTLKKFTTGDGRCGKDRMIEAMRRRWALPRLRDPDAADALAVLAWALEKEHETV